LIEVSAPSSVTAGQWQQVVVTYDGSSSASGVSVYVDGVSISTSVIADSQGTTTTATSAPYCIGARNTGSALFNGSLDDLRQYNRVLTQAEITHLAEARGIEGPPPVGLGTETQWLCPTLNNTNPLSDLSGSGNNASQIGTLATTSNTEEGGLFAYDLTGYPDGINSGIAGDGGATGLYSYSMWIKTDSTASYQRLVMDRPGPSNFMVTVNPGGVITASFDGSGLPTKSTDSAISAVQWYHIYCDQEGGTVRLYLDGVEQSGTTYAGGGGVNANVTYGYDSSGYVFVGLIDDVRKHDRVLTQSEITHLATSRGIEGSPSTPTTQYNAFTTHAFTQLFQQRLR